jgi:hypothetical protein
MAAFGGRCGIGKAGGGVGPAGGIKTACGPGTGAFGMGPGDTPGVSANASGRAGARGGGWASQDRTSPPDRGRPNRSAGRSHARLRRGGLSQYAGADWSVAGGSPRLPEVCRCVGHGRAGPSGGPLGVAGGRRARTRGAMGPKMKPIQHQNLTERPRRSAIQPDRKVDTTNKTNTEARPIM